MTNKHYLGIDIGGTNIVFGIVNESGEIVFQGTFQTGLYKDPKLLVKDIYQSYLLFSEKSKIKVEGIGIGAPNGNFYTGCIEFAPNLNWGEMIPVSKIFEEQFRLPVKITNDANAAAIGEKIFGGSKKMNDFVVLTLGTGLGSGIYVNGQIVYGKNGFAGEFGHTNCSESNRICTCGKKGCIETYVSSRGILQTYEEYYQTHFEKKPESTITPKEIYQMATKGDAVAVETYNRTAKVLGKSLSNLILILDPEAIFLFGGIAHAHSILIPQIKETIDMNVLPVLKGKTKILPSKLLDRNAAILGSAALFF